MRTIEEMRQYAEKTGVSDRVAERYDILLGEIKELYNLWKIEPFEAIGLAFKYGRAKGYRAGRKA